MLLLAGCGITGTEPNPLEPKGSVAEDQLFLIKLSLGIMIGVLVIVFALFFYVLIRYRKRRGQDDIPKQVEGNHILEIVWTVVPLLLLLVLAVPTVYYTFKFAEDYREHQDALQVNVTAHQYWWEFEYPDYGIITAQELYIPVNKTVSVDLISADVIHSFWVPALAGKMDTLVGMNNHMYFDAKEEGVYKGKCAELCGASHALMDFKVIAVSQEEFEAWVDKMQNPGYAIAEDTSQGQELFKNKCMACHAIDAGTPGLGPNLTNYADRALVAGFRPNDSEWLHRWIDKPDEMKPGTTMPEVPLSEDEITEIVNYLQTLK
ncbi:cytochrome c oxidase subunit 2 [Xylanibacillus composti]|uniref:Cytochrome c oxidase subunit 2 n=2 Tax=Xylanibacillus composti TaxID=1572762 RepID=A0A8J4H1I0_9BACL|nr:cytochrome c oxidase subunit 2 [Xylanibacillus composti]